MGRVEKAECRESTMNGPEKFSLCQLAVPDATFEQDVALAVELGIGLGLDANKLGEEADDDRLIALMRDSGVPATVCDLAAPTIVWRRPDWVSMATSALSSPVLRGSIFPRRARHC